MLSAVSSKCIAFSAYNNYMLYVYTFIPARLDLTVLQLAPINNIFAPLEGIRHFKTEISRRATLSKAMREFEFEFESNYAL